MLCYLSALVFLYLVLVAVNTNCSGESTIKCYQCTGDTCLSANIKVVSCENPCCYWIVYFGKNGLKNKKGCCKKKLVHYNTFCSKIKKVDFDLIDCQSCYADSCNNNQPLEKFECYSCDKCGLINANTSSINCRGKECCYTARYSEDQYKPMDIIRGCIGWIVGLQCNSHDTCKRVKSLIKLKHPNAVIPQHKSCKTCGQNEATLCNNKTYSIKCYTCKGKSCETTTTTTTTTRKCLNMCCYSLTTYGPEGVYNERNCTHDCNKFCESYKNQSIQRNHELLQCKTCNTNKCNNIKPRTEFRCHVCTNCYDATTETVECRGAECCYTVWLRDETYGLPYVSRGCMQWTMGLQCERKRTCDHIRETHRKKHPHGGVVRCEPCQLDSKSLCNRKPRKRESFNCFHCEGGDCVEVSSDSTTEKECSTMCCYSAVAFGTQGYWYERKCADDMRPCETWCERYKSVFDEKHGNLSLISCDNCSEDRCNSKALQHFSCYQCENCNDVGLAPRVACRDPACCYTTHWHHKPFEPLYVGRGCVEWSLGMTCTSAATGEFTKKLHETLHPDGPDSFGETVICDLNATSGCNGVTYIQPTITCYSCKGANCYGITNTMDVVVCEYLCCYSASVYSENGLILERGCATDIQQCRSYCDRYNIRPGNQRTYCHTCDSNNCNNDTLKQKFNCYQCPMCNEVNNITASIECISPLCCYTAYVSESEDEPLHATRGCLKWFQGMRCTQTNTCTAVESKYIHSKGCNTCHEEDNSFCNNKTYTPPVSCYECNGDTCTQLNSKTTPVVPCPTRCCYSATTYSRSGYISERKCIPENLTNCSTFCDNEYTKTQMDSQRKILVCKACDAHRCNTVDLHEHFKCYQCTNCNTLQNNSEPIDCFSPSCCYTAHIKNNPNENLHAIRGCLEWYYDITSCPYINTCQYIKNQHMKNYPNGAIDECFVCNDDDDSRGCNNDPYYPPALCYECIANCHENPKESQLVECPNQCCISMSIYSPQKGLANYRQCGQGECGTFCSNYENELLLKQSFAKLIYCKACTDFKCNQEKLMQPFRCYQCTRCNEVSKETTLVPCRAPWCCYTAYVHEDEDDGFYMIRGCAEHCQDACVEMEAKHYADHPLGEFDKCRVCNHDDQTGCNNDTFDMTTLMTERRDEHSVSCYKCKNCNEVRKNTTRVICPVDQCCYRAAVARFAHQPLAAVRGCIRQHRGESCYNSCHLVRNRYLMAYPNGTFHACVHCDEGDADGCNSERFAMPEVSEFRVTDHAIRCYSCVNCTRVGSVVSNVHCRAVDCCYAAVLNDGDGGSSYVVRGCADWNPSGDCFDTCSEVGRFHLEVHTGGEVEACEVCGEGAGDECNNRTYVVRRVKSGHISCYACIDCNEVSEMTGTVECLERKCCYRALVKREELQPLIAVRGCARMRRGQTCNQTCAYLEKNHYRVHPNGLFHVCIQCKDGDGERCNDHPFYSPDDVLKKEPGSIYCYDCRNCSTVTSRTQLVECLNPKCCYSAYMRDYAYTEYYAVRGCSVFKRGKVCVDVCRDVQAIFLWDHPLGKVKKCIPCGPNDGDSCNSYSFLNIRTTVVPDTSVLCYDCYDCPEVNQNTPTILCETPNCCYMSVMKDSVDKPVYVNRGCLSREKNCFKTCSILKNEHMWVNIPGLFINCTTCDEKDLDMCNNKPYYLLSATTIEPDTILCYSCYRCNSVNYRTPKVACKSPRCCYVVLITDQIGQTTFASRGCAATHNCLDTCDSVKEDHMLSHPKGSFDYCMTCNITERDECNKNNYNTPIFGSHTHPHSTVFECYHCIGCRTLPEFIRLTKPCPSRCCYVVAWTEDGHSFGGRLCAELHGKSCQHYCPHLKTIVRNQKPPGEIHYCNICNANRCNKEENLTSRINLPINCYTCENCSTNYQTTPSKKCTSSCCFSTLQTPTNPTRGCASVTPGHPCSKFCRNNKIKHPSAQQCLTCNKNNCNKQPLQPKSRKMLIQCYDCTGCYIPGPQETTNCISGCCYTILYTELNETNLKRGCAPNCNHQCQQLTTQIYQNDPNAEVQVCKTCTTNNCNDIPVYESSIKCYACTDCNELLFGAITPIECIAKCCCAYVLQMSDGSTISIRECAKLPPGYKCLGYCDYIRTKHKLTTCRCCDSEQCNKESLYNY